MATLEILTIPDTRLKHKSSIVEKFDQGLAKIIKDMFDTLYASGNGIGLAAPQVGIKKRIVVIDIKKEDVSNPMTFINPKIVKFSDEKFINEEGCLSVPEYYADVERAKEIEVEWYDENGKKKNDIFSGLMSICIQHEIDHLDGVLFIDHLSKLKRKLVIEKLKKIKKKIKLMNKLSPIKIGFFGTPDFSLQFLKYLFKENLLIKFVVSQPASKSGRGKKTKLSSVEKWSLEKKIPTFTPKNLNDNEFLNKLKKIPVDFIIVVAYGNLVNEKIINHPKFLTVNVHASLLPKWRGAAPIQRAILEGDKETGVTIMKVEEKLDAGPIIKQTKFKILEDNTAGEIFEKMIKIGQPLLVNAINTISKNTHNFITQLDEKASYAKKVEKRETKIIWDQPAKIIDRKIRAFNPVPGAWTKIKSSDTRIKIFKSEVICDNKIFKKANKCGSVTGKLIVKCGEDMIKIIELQPEGKSRMNANDFLNGLKIKEFIFE